MTEPIPYEIKCKLVQTIDVDKLLDNHTASSSQIDVFEGIDLSPAKNGGFQVSWTSAHNNGIKASPKSRPAVLDLSVPSLKIQDGKIQVFSLLQRTPLARRSGDGNPLVYLLKGHPDYKFKTDKDKQLVYGCIDGILKNFIAEFFKSIDGTTAVVLCPSGNALNMRFANKLNSLAKKDGHSLEVFDSVLTKMTVSAVEDLLLDGYEPSFNHWIASLPQAKADVKLKMLKADFDRMEKKHDGTFAFHLVRDRETRNHIVRSMVADKNGAEQISGRDVLLIDDTMTTGQTIREACETLCETYSPKSITALTLFSPLRR